MVKTYSVVDYEKVPLTGEIIRVYTEGPDTVFETDTFAKAQQVIEQIFVNKKDSDKVEIETITKPNYVKVILKNYIG